MTKKHKEGSIDRALRLLDEKAGIKVAPKYIMQDKALELAKRICQHIPGKTPEEIAEGIIRGEKERNEMV